MQADLVSPFREALERQTWTLREAARAGRGIIGYFCTYTPIEIIHAAGFLPVRILGGTGPVSAAYSLAPDFICPYMLRSLEKALQGEYDYLLGIVQGYTCDVACGLVNIWRENIDCRFFSSVSLPYNDTPAARDFFQKETANLIEQLTTAGGHFDMDVLDRSVTLYDTVRQYLKELHADAYANRLSLTAVDLHDISQAVDVLPPSMVMEMLKDLKVKLSEQPSPAVSGGVPVVVSGSLLASSALPAEIIAAGGRIVADDLCTGMRRLSAAKEKKDVSPMERIMARHFSRVPCPSRARAEERLPHLIQLAQSSGGRGVVFLLEKFCTPHLSDLPYLVNALKSSGIPSIVIETDDTGTTDSRMRTRLEGFFEMIRSE